jgi:hypothetical protein
MADDTTSSDGGAILVVAAESLAGDSAAAVGREARPGPGRPAPRVHLVSPALAGSALRHQMGDIDDAIAPARRRLEESLDALRAQGLEASGEVGDSDPVQAISDELQKLDVDRIVLVSHAHEDEARYAEKELFERVEREFDPPATELRVAEGGKRVEASRRGRSGDERSDEGHRFSANLPPIRLQDGLGIAVAAIGTIILILLAGSCDTKAAGEGFEIDACGVRYLLAGGFFLINIAHVVGLLLMESVGYRGPFERFFARMSFIGTPLAVVGSLLLHP